MDPLTLGKMHVVIVCLARTLQTFLTRYQTDAPMTPLLHKDLEDIQILKMFHSCTTHTTQRSQVKIKCSEFCFYLWVVKLLLF